MGSLRIGRFCALGDGIRIITSNHSLDFASIQLAMQKRIAGKVHIMEDKKDVVIGNDVWIGDAVIILPGVSIGNGAVIGAGSVVTKDVEPYTIVGGVLAVFIKRRFTENISMALERLRWWELDYPQLKHISFLFEKEIGKMNEDDSVNLIEKAIKEIQHVR